MNEHFSLSDIFLFIEIEKDCFGVCYIAVCAQQYLSERGHCFMLIKKEQKSKMNI